MPWGKLGIRLHSVSLRGRNRWQLPLAVVPIVSACGNSAGGYTCPEVVKTAIPVEIKDADRVPDLQKAREELSGMVYMLTLSDPTRRLLHSRPHPNGQAPARAFEVRLFCWGSYPIQSRRRGDGLDKSTALGVNARIPLALA